MGNVATALDPLTTTSVPRPNFIRYPSMQMESLHFILKAVQMPNHRFFVNKLPNHAFDASSCKSTEHIGPLALLTDRPVILVF
jgi:hypothetical protein